MIKPPPSLSLPLRWTNPEAQEESIRFTPSHLDGWSRPAQKFSINAFILNANASLTPRLPIGVGVCVCV
jgi:hypothetical protein